MSVFNSPAILTTPDVLIIGGGAAGVAAASGAAASGATAVLLEKNAFAGGMATTAYVGTICGLYYRNENPVARFMHHGFPEQFAVELAELSKTQPVYYKNGLHFLPYEQFHFIMLCDEWLKKSTQSLSFHSFIYDAVAESNCIVAVTAMTANKPVKYYPKTIIDATGEDVLAGLLHLNTLQSDCYQAAAQVFQLTGIMETDSAVLNLSLMRSVQKGIAANSLPSFFEHVSIVPGSIRNNSVLLKLALPINIDNNPQHRSDLELFSRRAILELSEFLKYNNESFKGCNITYVAAEAGIRTGPRHEGKYILTGADVINARKHPDTIARGAWPVEYWQPEKKVVMEYFEMNDYYDIPAGAIQSKTISNLFFCGRNISADDKAIASARVIGTCMATGYASGVLAAYQALNKSLEDAIVTVQSALSISSENS